MTLNIIRHRILFPADEWGETPVAIIGCGGSGSSLAWLLARLGIARIDLYDGDCIESHNIANQCFAMRDIGRNKAETLAENIHEDIGCDIQAYPKYVRDTQVLAPVVFLCIDTMTDRMAIMRTCIFHNPSFLRVFDGRMDASHAVVYSVDPNDETHVALWEHYWFPDDEATNDTAACGGRLSVAYTANVLSGVMTHEFVRWNGARQTGAPVPNRRWFDLEKNEFHVDSW